MIYYFEKFRTAQQAWPGVDNVDKLSHRAEALLPVLLKKVKATLSVAFTIQS
jgi:hypothetical protein